MNKEKAKELMEIQSCITFFCDRYLDTVESLPDSEIKNKLSEGMREVIGINLTEAMIPIYRLHESLNPYSNSSLAEQWFNNAKKKLIAQIHTDFNLK